MPSIRPLSDQSPRTVSSQLTPEAADPRPGNSNAMAAATTTERTAQARPTRLISREGRTRLPAGSNRARRGWILGSAQRVVVFRVERVACVRLSAPRPVAEPSGREKRERDSAEDEQRDGDG